MDDCFLSCYEVFRFILLSVCFTIPLCLHMGLPARGVRGKTAFKVESEGFCGVAVCVITRSPAYDDCLCTTVEQPRAQADDLEHA